jgi:hypothetical protein
VRDVASRLSADQVLFLAVVKLGSRIQIDPTWTTGDGEQAVSREAVVLEEGGGGAADVLAEVAPRLLPGEPLRPRRPAWPSGSGPAGGAVGAAGPPPPDPPDADRPGGVRIRIHIGTWIAGGVALAALGGGIGFGLAARSADQQLAKDGCGDRIVCDESRIESLERKMLAADILYGVAAASAVTAAVIQWRLGSREPPTVRVTVSGGGDSAVGLAVTGHF